MHLNNRADFADFKAVEQIFEDQSRHCHLKRQQLHWALHGENMGPGGVSPVAGIALGCVGGGSGFKLSMHQHDLWAILRTAWCSLQPSRENESFISLSLAPPESFELVRPCQ